MLGDLIGVVTANKNGLIRKGNLTKFLLSATNQNIKMEVSSDIVFISSLNSLAVYMFRSYALRKKTALIQPLDFKTYLDEVNHCLYITPYGENVEITVFYMNQDIEKHIQLTNEDLTGFMEL